MRPSNEYNTLSAIHSNSYLNNVSMKDLFKKMKLSRILMKIDPYNKKMNSNLFERVKSSPGPHLDRDIKLSQSILQKINHKHVIDNKHNYDIHSIIPNNEIVNGTSTPMKNDIKQLILSEPLLSNYKKRHFFCSNSLLKINNDSYDEFISELNKDDNNKNNANDKHLEDSTHEINIKKRLLNKAKHLIEQKKEYNIIKPESLIKKPKKMFIDSNKISNTDIHIRIPKITERFLKLNKNSIKMKSNLHKELNSKSQLRLNNNYIKKQGKDGIEIYLDYYLTPLNNNKDNSSIELTSPICDKERKKKLSHCKSTSSIPSPNIKQYWLSMNNFHRNTSIKPKLKPTTSASSIILNECFSDKNNKINLPVKFSSNKIGMYNEIDHLNKWRLISNKGFTHIIEERKQEKHKKMINISDKIEKISRKINRKIDDCKVEFFNKVDTVKNLKKGYLNDNIKNKSIN